MKNETMPEGTLEQCAAMPVTSPVEAVDGTAANAEAVVRRKTNWKRIKRRHHARAASFSFLLAGLGVSIFLQLMVLFLLAPPVAGIGSLLSILSLMGVNLAVGIVWINRRKPVLQAGDSAAMKGAEAVGHLLDMLGTAVYTRDYLAIYEALTPRLLEIGPDDAALLTLQQRRILDRFLKFNAVPAGGRLQHADFCVAALHAIEAIGDASFVPTVERMADMKVRTPEKQRIRDAARECLPLLKARAGLVAHAQMLLRPSSPEAAGRDTLVRPARAEADTAPSELVRAASGPGNGESPS